MKINIVVEFDKEFIDDYPLPYIDKISLITFDKSSYNLIFDTNFIKISNNKKQIEFTLLDFNENKSSDNIILLQNNYTKIYSIKECHIGYSRDGYKNKPYKIISMAIVDDELLIYNFKSTFGVEVDNNNHKFILNDAITRSHKFIKTNNIFQIKNIEIMYKDFYQIIPFYGKVYSIKDAFDICIKRSLPTFRAMNRYKKIDTNHIHINKINIIEDNKIKILFPHNIYTNDCYWK